MMKVYKEAYIALGAVQPVGDGPQDLLKSLHKLGQTGSGAGLGINNGDYMKKLHFMGNGLDRHIHILENLLLQPCQLQYNGHSLVSKLPDDVLEEIEQEDAEAKKKSPWTSWLNNFVKPKKKKHHHHDHLAEAFKHAKLDTQVKEWAALLEAVRTKANTMGQQLFMHLSDTNKRREAFVYSFLKKTAHLTQANVFKSKTADAQAALLKAQAAVKEKYTAWKKQKADIHGLTRAIRESIKKEVASIDNTTFIKAQVNSELQEVSDNIFSELHTVLAAAEDVRGLIQRCRGLVPSELARLDEATSEVVQARDKGAAVQKKYKNPEQADLAARLLLQQQEASELPKTIVAKHKEYSKLRTKMALALYKQEFKGDETFNPWFSMNQNKYLVLISQARMARLDLDAAILDHIDFMNLNDAYEEGRSKMRAEEKTYLDDLVRDHPTY